MQRASNFKKDIQIGKVGETDLERILSSSNKCEHFENVTENPFFQLIDIDYIQFTRLKDDGTQYTANDVQQAILSHVRRKDMDWCILYEVKTDSVSTKYGNVVYELISHDGPGCAAISRADRFYYVFVSEYNLEKIEERWLIDMKKWREYIRQNCEEEVKKSRDDSLIRLNNFNRTGDKVLNFLVKIKDMEKAGVAINVTKK